MQRRIIRICYKKVIDVNAQPGWEKLLWENTWQELFMQQQFYNNENKHKTFAALLNNVPADEKLHFRASTAAVGYLRQLNSFVPDVYNNRGNRFLTFSDFKFEIIDSDFSNKTKHRIAISFFSDGFVWHETVADYLLLCAVGTEETKDGLFTHMLRMQPYLDIYSLKEETV